MANVQNKKERVCVTILVTAAGAEAIALFTMVIVWSSRRHGLVDLQEHLQQMVCSTQRHGDYVETNGTCPHELVQQSGTGATYCCRNASQMFDKLVNKSVHERYDSNVNPEVSFVNLTQFNCKVSDTKEVYAKLSGLAHHPKPVRVGISWKVFWSQKLAKNSTEALRHLHDDGSIYVTMPAFYFVASQIKLAMNGTSGVSGDTFRHYVHMISRDGGGLILLEGVKHECEQSTPGGTLTSHVGAVFKLEKGDRLYVATSHPNILETRERDNYFHIHKI